MTSFHHSLESVICERDRLVDVLAEDALIRVVRRSRVGVLEVTCHLFTSRLSLEAWIEAERYLGSGGDFCIVTKAEFDQFTQGGHERRLYLFAGLAGCREI